MILSCEPGIYIRKEGIGIRIENDLLITEGEPINLFAGLPTEIAEIEEAMKK
jgi:Xaa-Pro aminopeptidase